MIEFGIRRPEDAIAARTHAQAEIHIVEGNRQIGLIETTDLSVHLAARDETCAGHGREILQQLRAPHVAPIPARLILVRVAGNAADAEHDAGMLDQTIRVVELRADRADLRAQGMAYHLA